MKKIDSQKTAAADLLAASPLFSTFSAAELDFLAEKSEFLDHGDGSPIFVSGTSADRLYLVADGGVVIRAPGGGSVLAEYVVGDSFGELDFLTGAAHNAEALATGPTTLLAFPAGGAGLRDALSARPEVAARILRSFLLVIAGRTRVSNALVKENSLWVRELRRQVYGDKLTGILNKAYLEENLPKLLTPPLALLMMKPDNFKDINDRFGHEVGDAVLVRMAQEFDRAVGDSGTAVRYEGNELAAALPGADRSAAVDAARRLQDRLGSLDLTALTKDPTVRLRTSFGIALFPEHGADAPTLIKAAAGLPLVARGRGGSLILFPEDAA